MSPRWARGAAARPTGPAPTSTTGRSPCDIEAGRVELAWAVIGWSPLVLDGEMVACAECGEYRDWL
ncbi:hypothetical protein ABTZ98_32935, partial [Streptomyces bacillaris]